jgi:3-deoxy-manno-octulosonate cytidylyltransferase (CMP-KDO synthetase)
MKNKIEQEELPSVFIMIPARFASRRLPGKPLLKIGGQSLISHVAHRAQLFTKKISQSGQVKQAVLVVATDHEDIFSEIKKLGILAVMTSSNLHNGTERVFAAMKSLKENYQIKDKDFVVNIQGDEPFFSISDLENLIFMMLPNENIPMGTLAFQRNDAQLFFSSSVVKVIRDQNNFALYFSRAPLPFPQNLLGSDGKTWFSNVSQMKDGIDFLQHVGIYVYRYDALVQFATHMKKSNLELIENLEQLRALEEGWKILVFDALQEPFGIDTPEDLKKAQTYLNR